MKAGNVDEFLRDMSDYARLGVDEVIVVPPDDRPAHWIEDCCGKAVSRLSDLCAD